MNPTDQTHGALPAQPTPLRALALVLARLFFGGTAFAAFLGLFAEWSSFAEITTHFRVPYVGFAAFAVVFALVARQRMLTAVSAAILVWALGGVVPWYTAAPPPVPSGGTTLTIMTANVNLHNKDANPLLDLVAKEAPDLLLLQEVTPAWFEQCRHLYPHRAEVPHRSYFGLALYSRFPIENVQQDDPVNRDVPILRADLDVEGRRVHVMNVHLPSPESRKFIEIRLAQYAWLTEYLAGLDGPAIVAGDFNCTMWSPLYKRLVGRGDLVNTRQGYGMMPTWLPLAGSLHLLPIDHILVRGMFVTDARLGLRIGSDHSPFVAEVRLGSATP